MGGLRPRHDSLVSDFRLSVSIKSFAESDSRSKRRQEIMGAVSYGILRIFLFREDWHGGQPSNLAKRAPSMVLHATQPPARNAEAFPLALP